MGPFVRYSEKGFVNVASDALLLIEYLAVRLYLGAIELAIEIKLNLPNCISKSKKIPPFLRKVS